MIAESIHESPVLHFPAGLPDPGMDRQRRSYVRQRTLRTFSERRRHRILKSLAQPYDDVRVVDGQHASPRIILRGLIDRASRQSSLVVE